MVWKQSPCTATRSGKSKTRIEAGKHIFRLYLHNPSTARKRFWKVYLQILEALGILILLLIFGVTRNIGKSPPNILRCRPKTRRAIRYVPLLAEGTDKFIAATAEVVSRHPWINVVFDLIMQSAIEPLIHDVPLDVPACNYLLHEPIVLFLG